MESSEDLANSELEQGAAKVEAPNAVTSADEAVDEGALQPEPGNEPPMAMADDANDQQSQVEAASPEDPPAASSDHDKGGDDAVPEAQALEAPSTMLEAQPTAADMYNDHSQQPIETAPPAAQPSGINPYEQHVEVPPRLLTQSTPAAPSDEPLDSPPAANKVILNPQLSSSINVALKTHDPLVLAKNVLQARSYHEQYEQHTQHKLQQVDAKRTKAIKPVATLNTPASLVLRPPRGMRITTPQGWKDHWDATDCKQVLAADKQVYRAMQDTLQKEKRDFVAALAARQAEAAGKATSLGTSRGSSPTRAVSPAVERQQRVMVSAQQLYQQRQASREQSLTHKHAAAQNRVRSLESHRLSECNAKHQNVEHGISNARERQAQLAWFKSAVLEHGLHHKMDRLQQGSLRKDASAVTVNQERATRGTQAAAVVLNRHQQLQDSLKLHNQKRRQALDAAMEAADRRHTGMLSAQSSRAASLAKQHADLVAERQQQLKQLNSQAEERAIEQQRHKQAKREALLKARASKEQEVKSKQVSEMVCRYYAKEFELAAMITKKLPRIEPYTQTTLARHSLAV